MVPGQRHGYAASGSGSVHVRLGLLGRLGALLACRAWESRSATRRSRLVDGKNYAVLATVNADGSPQTSVMWVGRDGGDLLFSTVQGRVKHRNMVRDPRVSVTVSTPKTRRTTSSCAAG